MKYKETRIENFYWEKCNIGMPLIVHNTGYMQEYKNLMTSENLLLQSTQSSIMADWDSKNLGTIFACNALWLNTRDFKIVHDGRLGQLDECHVTQNPRDIWPSCF